MIAPDIDNMLGMGAYATTFRGLGRTAKIRVALEDFAVYEVISAQVADSIRACGTDVSKDRGYAVYKLQKLGMDTTHALSAIRKRTGVGLKALGLKDASALTEQYVCSKGSRMRLPDMRTGRYQLECVGFAERPLVKKDMVGNHFRIKITGGEGDPALFKEYDKILNFYGYQRFGSRRPVTHLVGRAVVKRDFDEAIRLILEFTSKHDSEEHCQLRSGLANTNSYAKSAAGLPQGMDIERLVLEELARHNDTFKAFRAVPLQMRRLYISAYQSYIFNCVLSTAFSDGEDLFEAVHGDVCFDRTGKLAKYDGNSGDKDVSSGRRASDGRDVERAADGLRRRAMSVTVPMPGYSYYSKTRFAPYMSSILADENISTRDFFIKEMQEISGEGGFRDAVMQCGNYSWDPDDRTVEFVLSRGSFATVMLREMIKPPDPFSAGF